MNTCLNHWNDWKIPDAKKPGIMFVTSSMPGATYRRHPALTKKKRRCI
jgi:hypothetical protein